MKNFKISADFLQQTKNLENNIFDFKPNKNSLDLQTNLTKALHFFCENQTKHATQFMLIKAENNEIYLNLIKRFINEQISPKNEIIGENYFIENKQIFKVKASSNLDNFAAKQLCNSAFWFEDEQLLGFLTQNNDNFSLNPGLIHQTNGGFLILSLQSFLANPLLWFRFKQIVLQKKDDWLFRPLLSNLPCFIPPINIDLRVILVGSRLDLGDFQDLDPNIFNQSIYAEFESILQINNENEFNYNAKIWANFVQNFAQHHEFSLIENSAFPFILNEAIRFTEDRLALPLNYPWILKLLSEAQFYANEKFDENAFLKAKENKNQRERFLPDLFLNEILQNQIKIETFGEKIGQINGLSYIEYPGHPKSFGEPCRITCVLKQGNGEFNDVENHANLSGDIHTKGMMIMQAFIAHELSLEQEIPYLASIAFEQSYSEIDGDSASLAALSAYVSALSLLPIDQQIAVTGSVDQFGNIQAIGGINKKIESFFYVCKAKNLTKNQGVIFPKSNLRHLCLNDEIINAIKNNDFHLWAIDHATDAFELLMKKPYKSKTDENTIFKHLQNRLEQKNEKSKSFFTKLIFWN